LTKGYVGCLSDGNACPLLTSFCIRGIWTLPHHSMPDKKGRRFANSLEFLNSQFLGLISLRANALSGEISNFIEECVYLSLAEYRVLDYAHRQDAAQ